MSNEDLVRKALKSQTKMQSKSYENKWVHLKDDTLMIEVSNNRNKKTVKIMGEFLFRIYNKREGISFRSRNYK